MFRFVVNGQEVSIKGPNWVPLEAFHSSDAQCLDETLALATELNCNMIRCWGSNVYEAQAFFDFCDENGILVWKDFAPACALSADIRVPRQDTPRSRSYRANSAESSFTGTMGHQQRD